MGSYICGGLLVDDKTPPSAKMHDYVLQMKGDLTYAHGLLIYWGG